MRIAIIGSRGYPYVYSGYETFVKELAERLVKKGIDVTVYCHRNLFKRRPDRVSGINLVYIPTVESKTLSQFIHSLQAMIHASLKRYDVILVVNSANGPFGLFTKALRIKTAINVDGLEWLRPKWRGLGSKYFYLASKLASKFYDVIINDSFEMRKVYEKEFGVESTVIAYGADIRYSTNPGLITIRGLSKWDYYLVVGRLIPDNNARLIINEFIRTGSARKLVIVGDVMYKDDYAWEIKKISDPRLVFTGYITDQDELTELYTNCFAYIHGHEFGGTNPTLLKALGSGCAVFSLDTVFSREVLSGTRYGLLFPKERNGLKKLIEDVERDPPRLECLRNNSRNRIIENYSWEKITDQYVELFNSMIIGIQKDKRRC